MEQSARSVQLARTLSSSLQSLAQMMETTNCSVEQLSPLAQLTYQNFLELMTQFNIETPSAAPIPLTAETLVQRMGEITEEIRKFWQYLGFTDSDINIRFNGFGDITVIASMELDPTSENTDSCLCLNVPELSTEEIQSACTSRLIDCDANRERIITNITTRFKTVNFLQWESMGQFKGKQAYLSKLTFSIELTDF